jgi:hypothetical protein
VRGAGAIGLDRAMVKGILISNFEFRIKNEEGDADSEILQLDRAMVKGVKGIEFQISN